MPLFGRGRQHEGDGAGDEGDGALGEREHDEEHTRTIARTGSGCGIRMYVEADDGDEERDGSGREIWPVIYHTTIKHGRVGRRNWEAEGMGKRKKKGGDWGRHGKKEEVGEEEEGIAIFERKESETEVGAVGSKEALLNVLQLQFNYIIIAMLKQT